MDLKSGRVDSSVEPTEIEVAEAKRYRLLLDMCGDILIFFRPGGQIIETNAASIAAYGYAKEEFLSKTMQDLRAVETHAEIPSQIEAARSGPISFETVHIRCDGTRFPVEASWTFDRIGGEEVILSVIRDISERKQAEETLYRTQRELQDFVENASMGMHRVGANGIILWANQAELQMLGYAQEEYVGHHIAEFHADEPAIQDILGRLTRDETLNDYEARLRCKDGSIRNVLINSNVLWESGKFVHTRCFTRDITAHKQVEAANSLLASIVESSQDAIVSKGLDGIIISWNRGAENLFYYSEQEAMGQPITMLIPADRLAEETNIQANIRQGKRVIPYETIRSRKDGTLVHVSLSVSPIVDGRGQVVGASKVARDITAHKQAEEKLRESENRKSAILSAALDAIISMDHEGIISDFNPAAEQTFGYGRDEAIGQSLADLIIPERLRQRHCEGLVRYLATGDGPVLGKRIELPALHADGREFPAELSISRIADLEPPMFTATLRDITPRKQAESELLQRNEEIRDNETRLRLATEATAVGIWEWNILTNEIRWDPLLFRIYGITPTQDGFIQYSDWSGAVLPEDLPENERVLQDLLRSGGESRREFRIRRRDDGQIREIESVETVRLNEQGVAEWVIGTNLDVTERRWAKAALSESDERYRAAVSAVSDLIWTNNSDGVMEGEQQGWADFTGQSREEYQGYGWSNAVHPEDAKSTIDAWAMAVTEKCTFVFEHRVRRHDGEWRDCSIRAVPILNSDGMIREWVGVHTDITERKRNEAHLRQLADDLTESDRRKNEFLATLAHELRNPLAPIRTGLELMKRTELHGETIEQTRSMMERQLTQLVRLVDDLMDISRINQGKIELRKEPVQLAAVLNNAVETSRPLIEQMGHELTVTLPTQPIVVDADMTRLAQVFMNLINNAAKYGDPGGHIWLSGITDGDYIVVTVKDDGLGISADQLHHIFELFAQVDPSLGRSQGGLGIGLTLVKSLVEMHGGTVEARSEGLGKGCEFIVRLPMVADAPNMPMILNRDEHPVPSSLRILIVDDNQDLAHLMSLLLKATGNEICIAHDGQEGLDKAEKFKPDVVLLDIGLPVLNGYEACRRIREKSWGKNVCIIASTGWGGAEDRRQTQEAGFDHHMVKPVDMQAMLKILEGVQANRKEYNAQG